VTTPSPRVAVGRPVGGWGRAVAAPTVEHVGVPTEMVAPMAHSWEATTVIVTWMVVMVVTRSTGAMPTVAEVTEMVSRSKAGGVTMMKAWIEVDLGWIKLNQVRSELK
jgi:hypothetical protein